MNVTVKGTSPSERILTVTIERKEVEKAYQQAFTEASKRLKIKGFRQGNVPTNIAKKHLTDAHLVRRVVNVLVPPAYKQALKDLDLQPLGKPDWELKESTRGKDLIFEATLHVMPILAIKGYADIPLQLQFEPATDIQIEQVLRQRQQGAARYVDRPPDHRAQLGDFAFIDYQATVEQLQQAPTTMSNFLLEMLPEKFLPGFVEQLVGAVAGEERSFSLKLPGSYADANLAGKSVDFSVKIHQIKERVVPALDDDFARTQSNAETLVKLKEVVRKNLDTRAQRRAEDEFINEVIKKLVHQIDPASIPFQLQEGHARLALRNQTRTLEKQGTTIEQHLQRRGISSEDFGEELKLTGLVEARLEILYRSIAAAEKLEVLTKEVDQAIITQAKSSKQSPKDLKSQMLKDDTYKLLAYRILIGKVRKALLERAFDFSAATAKEQAPVSGGSREKAVTKRKSSSKAKSKSKAKTSTAKKAGAAKTSTNSKKPKTKSKTVKPTEIANLTEATETRAKAKPKAKAKAKKVKKSEAATTPTAKKSKSKAKTKAKPKAKSSSKSKVASKAKSKSK